MMNMKKLSTIVVTLLTAAIAGFSGYTLKEPVSVSQVELPREVEKVSEKSPYGSIKDKDFGAAFVNEVTSIYDGDTFRVSIAGWPGIVGERISIRVNGIDTPEMRGKCQEEVEKAREAKQFVVAQLRGAKQIELRNMKRGKYFRILADVYIDGKNLSEMLINQEYARPYDGGTKSDWCS